VDEASRLVAFSASSLRAVPPSAPEISRVLPATLRDFLNGSCGLSVDAFHFGPGAALPEPARSLLDHTRDMTSTLAAHHGSALRVEVLRCRTEGGLYLREVFLRTQSTDKIVEYGVLAVALAEFSAEARAAIEAGRTPLGAVLHQFKIPFVSAPIGFFTADAASLASTPLAVPVGSVSCGRFNRLATPAGETLAWIMEILPPVPA
jgi:hypothetical protein